MSLFSRLVSRFTSRESSPRAELFARIQDLSKRFESLAQAHDRRFRALEHDVVWKTDQQFAQQEAFYHELAQEWERWLKHWEVQSVASETLMREWEAWKKQRPKQGTKELDRAQILFLELVARGHVPARGVLASETEEGLDRSTAPRRKPTPDYIPTALAADVFAEVNDVYAPRVQVAERERDRVWKSLQAHAGYSEEALHRAYTVKRLTHDIARWRRLQRPS